MAKIQFTTPEGLSGEVELTAERMTLGRADDNALVISHDSISSHHGEVFIDNNAWVLADLGSTNGTKIGGERVESFELSHGGTFTLGHVECVFIGDYAEEQEEEAPAYQAAPTHTVSSTGYAATPINKGSRTGFGAATKPPSYGYGPLYLLGLIGLAACGYAIFTFMNLSA
ncbi:MAG: FHA domain-containing protein [Verrucomicrobia bacterium]|nr:FHA domain-containing protein [Verrucomicrobiota bacterium]